MRELAINEIQQISGAGYFRPSDWMYTGGAGALVGTAAFVVTAFSAHPLALVTALAVGSSTGMSLHAVHDILRYYDL